jgi:hypothetical protein
VTQWRALWYQIWPNEDPDDRVAASLDEIANICSPYQDDPFLVIAMYQHRHGQLLKTSIADWLEDHGGDLLNNIRDAAHAALMLDDSAGKARFAVERLNAVHDAFDARVRGALLAVDRARSDLSDQADESRSAFRAVKEQMSWVRPTLLSLLTTALLISVMGNAFLAQHAFVERPGDVIWKALSDGERRQLPSFILSGALADVLNCRVVGMEIAKDRCLPQKVSNRDDAQGWQLPPDVAARAAHQWSAERP